MLPLCVCHHDFPPLASLLQARSLPPSKIPWHSALVEAWASLYGEKESLLSNDEAIRPLELSPSSAEQV